MFCSVHVDSVSLLLQFLGQLSAAHKAHSASLDGGGAGKGQMAIITLCASFVLIISGGQKRFGLKKVGAGEWTFNENLHNQNRVFWLLDGELRLLAHVTLLSTTFENRRIEIKSELISLITERVASGSA